MLLFPKLLRVPTSKDSDMRILCSMTAILFILMPPALVEAMTFGGLV